MASKSTNKTTGEVTIQVVLNKKRRSIWLGKASPATVETVHANVQELEAAKVAGRAPAVETARWVARIDDRMHRKLAKAGLVEPRAAAVAAAVVTLGAFLAKHVAGRSTVKESTRTIYGHTKRCLINYFERGGKPRSLAAITADDADQWREWLESHEKLSRSTVARRCGIAKQFFRAAVRARLIEENPFEGMKGITVQRNAERYYFVSHAEAAKVLAACPDTEWKLIFALSRYGGLRCPSEHQALRWIDVDYVNWTTMTVQSPKTAHQGKASRVVPIFPELRPFLQAAWEEAQEGSEYVLRRYRGSNANLRTQLQRFMVAAGVKAWPKLFQNLRSSRQTELAEKYPIQVVCEWIGNTQTVAAKHYLQVTEDHLARAINTPTVDPKTLHKPVQTDTDTGGRAPTDESSKRTPLVISDVSAADQWALQDSNL
jgi:integrase